jgi:predicted transcriptional regulator
MSNDKLKSTLHKLIDDADEGFLHLVQEAAAHYYSGETQEELDAGILESEEDIKAGRVYTLDEMIERIKTW